MDKPLSSKIASELLRVKAVKLRPNEPFTWASGWKSPIYCDNRVSLSYPEFRTLIKKAFADLVKENFPQVDVIAGVATAGIPQGALIADELGLPFIYVRSKPKGHGMTNMIEGEIMPGKRVFVIEDLISTGGSSIKAIEAIRAADMNVLGLGAIFTYGFPQAAKNLEEANVKAFTLSDYSTLIEIALRENYVESNALDSLNGWRVDPESWKG